MVAPAYPAINLAAGTHTIEWVYRAPTPYPFLFLVAILVVLALHAAQGRIELVLRAIDRRGGRVWAALLSPESA